MTRRPQLDPLFDAWLRRLGAQIRAVRKAQDLTQAQAAALCAMAYKQFQSIEYGQSRLTAYTLFNLAHGFGVDPIALMPPPVDGSATALPASVSRTRPRWTSLVDAGWRIRKANDAPAPRHSVPVYDLWAAAGPAGNESRVPAVVAWAQLPKGRRTPTEGLFLAQAHGNSMEPLVQDGAWCLFRQPVTPPLLGRVVLVRTAPTGEGDSGHFQIKRIGALQLEDDGEGVCVRLDSLNPAVPSITVRAAGEAELQALGELVEVVVGEFVAERLRTAGSA